MQIVTIISRIPNYVALPVFYVVYYDETHPQALTSCCQPGLRMTPSVVKHPEGRCSVEDGFQKPKSLPGVTLVSSGVLPWSEKIV